MVSEYLIRGWVWVGDLVGNVLRNVYFEAQGDTPQLKS